MMHHDLIPGAGKRLLFWDDRIGGELQPLLDLLGVVPGGRKYGQPKDHIRTDVSRTDREALACALQIRSPENPEGGDVLMGYMGWADCRICGVQLGTQDLGRFGFVWPEGCEHYILAHDVWVPGLDFLLAAARGQAA